VLALLRSEWCLVEGRDDCTKSRYGGRLGRDRERRKTAYTLM
jgi:hypothetical protein